MARAVPETVAPGSPPTPRRRPPGRLSARAGGRRPPRASGSGSPHHRSTAAARCGRRVDSCRRASSPRSTTPSRPPRWGVRIRRRRRSRRRRADWFARPRPRRHRERTPRSRARRRRRRRRLRRTPPSSSAGHRCLRDSPGSAGSPSATSRPAARFRSRATPARSSRGPDHANCHRARWTARRVAAGPARGTARSPSRCRRTDWRTTRCPWPPRCSRRRRPRAPHLPSRRPLGSRPRWCCSNRRPRRPRARTRSIRGTSSNPRRCRRTRRRRCRCSGSTRCAAGWPRCPAREDRPPRRAGRCRCTC